MPLPDFETHELYKGRVLVRYYPVSHQYWVAVKKNGKFREFSRRPGVTTITGIKDKSAGLVLFTREEALKHLLPAAEAGKKIAVRDLVNAVYASDVSRDRSRDLGIAIHDWAEAYVKFRLGAKGFEQMPDMPEDPNVLTGTTSFVQWESEHKVRFLWSEKILYSLKYGYIGRGDVGAKVDGRTCLVDLKSGNGLYNSVRMQTAAYATADAEESGAKYSGRWAIRLSKETPEEYEARMELKARIREIMGSRTAPAEPYRAFEAKFLDDEEGFMARDLEAFLAAQHLYEWDRETDFWREKGEQQ